MDEIDEMKKCFEREGLDVDWLIEPPMFYPYIKSETKDIRAAKQIVKDFGFTLKFYMPGARDIDFDAAYEIVKKEV